MSSKINILFCSLFLLSACATNHLQYAPSAEEWAQEPLPEEAPAFTLFTTGDLGENPDTLLLTQLAAQLKEAPEESAMVFLGNQLPNGFPPETDTAGYREAVELLQLQLSTLDDFEGKIFFLAGNRDWAHYGVDGVERQEDFIEDYLDEGGVFEPKPGCGDPEEVEVTDEITFLLLDSQWWVGSWEGDPEVNDGCEIKSRTYFWQFYEDAIKGNRSKNVVILSHHPVYSAGRYGSNYTAKNHLLPLPVVGSVVTLFRSAFASPQFLSHPRYRELRDVMVSSAQKNGNFIFAAAHENGLQLIEKEDQVFVGVSGGQPSTPMRGGDGAAFLYPEAGFSKMYFYENGASWVEFFTAGSGNQPVFRRQMHPGRTTLVQVDTNLQSSEALPDSIQVPISQYDYQRKGLGLWAWGAHYREAYAQDLRVPVMKLHRFKGGVEPIQRGGGYQTNSLRLEAENGRQYTMRSVEKDPSRTIAYPFNTEIVLGVIRDNFSAAHPLSATPIPPLAQAVDVYHTNPRVFYTPKQSELSIFNNDYGEALYLVEERPDDEVWKDAVYFGEPDKILSTSDAVEEMIDKHNHVIDFDWVVRSRLFDILIGDWDRHDDQWRWAMIKDQGPHELDIMRPIPRDRDQAFSEYDGVIAWIVRQTGPRTKAFRPYSGKVNHVKWTSNSARQFDPTFLAGADWSDWETQIQHLQLKLTDSLIDSSFREQWPEQIYQLDGPQITKALKQRRDKLAEFAREFYLLHSKEVDVVGTEEHDLFLVERINKDSTRVRVWGLTDERKEPKFVYFDRTFLTAETQWINLFGLDGEDRFEIKGKVKKGPKLRVIGGLEKDVFIDESEVNGWKHHTLIYDAESEARELTESAETGLRISDDPKYNTYNRKALDYEFNYLGLLPFFGFNPDDGFLIGGLGSYTTYGGYRKEPYSAQHRFSGLYAAATNGLSLNYNGQFIDAIGNWELGLNGRLQTPLYATNFYGLGNETENPEEELGKDYNRVRQRLYSVGLSFNRQFDSNAQFSIGPVFQSYRLEATEGRLIGELAPDLNPDYFTGIDFLGIRSAFSFVNLDDAAFPSRGVRLSAEAGYNWALEGGVEDVPYLSGALSLYQNLDRDRQLVFATRIGFRHLFQEDFPFFQGATLGGVGPDRNFRGFRRERFTGQTAFYQNTDLRWDAFEWDNSLIPMSVGFSVGFDYGRVWLVGEDSNLWHYAYGGGLFLSPFDLLSINLQLFQGDGGLWRFQFGGGFFF